MSNSFGFGGHNASVIVGPRAINSINPSLAGPERAIHAAMINRLDKLPCPQWRLSIDNG